jgi:predicted DCC family thiol-disulfide oxidoreductase YuxK
MRSSDLTHATVAPSTPVLVYDGGCRFCTRVATWVVAHSKVAVTAVPFSDLPRAAWLTSLPDSEIERQAHFIATSGIEYHGGAAMTAALRHTRYRPFARLLDAPGLRLARDAGYELIVRWRGPLSKILEWASRDG